MKPEAAEFQARIYRIGQLRCVDVPPGVSTRLGAAPRIPVRVRIGDGEGQTNLVRTRAGGHRLYLAAALRRRPPVDSGDRVRVRLRPDPEGAEPELPADLVAALRRVPGGMAALRSRSPADRRQLVRWIEQPKSAAARAHRIDKALVLIQRGPPKRPPRARRPAGIACVFCLALTLQGVAAAAASAANGAPDAGDLHLYYLHGAIIEDKGVRPVSEQYGVYEYEKILDTFREKGFTVHSEARPRGTDPERYARRLAERIRELIDAGVPPERITVVGASKGAVIAMLTSTYLREKQVGFVTIAACNDWVFDHIDFDLYGRILSIYEASDGRNGSCREEYLRRSRGISRFEEIKVSTGLGHGVLYRPIDEWVGPAVDWARAPLRSLP